MSLDIGRAKKCTNFTQNEIEMYLDRFKKLIIEDKYTISINDKRKENIEFIEEYRIDTEKEKEILLNIECNDFCYAVYNEKEGYEHEKLYIFCKCYELYNWGELEVVDIYIKTNIFQTRRDDILIIVSFHKKNKKLKHLFK